MNLYRRKLNQDFPVDFTHVSLLKQAKLSREIEGQLAEAQVDPEVEEVRLEVHRRRSLTLKVFLLGTVAIVMTPVVVGLSLLAFAA